MVCTTYKPGKSKGVSSLKHAPSKLEKRVSFCAKAWELADREIRSLESRKSFFIPSIHIMFIKVSACLILPVPSPPPPTYSSEMLRFVVSHGIPQP